MLSTEILVKKALLETLQLQDESSIQLTHRLRDDLQLDSMSSLMFLMRLEETVDGFFVDPETLELSDLETVSTVVQYINKQINGKTHHVH